MARQLLRSPGGDTADNGNAGEGLRPQRHVQDPRQRAERGPAVDDGARRTGQGRDQCGHARRTAGPGVRPAELQRAGQAAQPQEGLAVVSGGGSGLGLRLATAGVLVVLGIAIGWGLYGNTSSPLSFETDPGAKSDGIPAEGVDAAAAAAVPGRPDRVARTDAPEVRRHHGLRAGHLSRGLRVTGPHRTPTTSAGCCATPTAAAGAIRRTSAQERRDDVVVDLAPSTSRRSSATSARRAERPGHQARRRRGTART